MVEFCPECASLLRKKNMAGEIYLACKCGYQEEVKKSQMDLEKEVELKKKALKDTLIVVGDEDKISIYPKVSKICPKCGHKQAEAWQVQTRSADEPSTSFFKCVKCKFSWREY